MDKKNYVGQRNTRPYAAKTWEDGDASISANSLAALGRLSMILVKATFNTVLFFAERSASAFSSRRAELRGPSSSTNELRVMARPLRLSQRARFLPPQSEF